MLSGRAWMCSRRGVSSGCIRGAVTLEHSRTGSYDWRGFTMNHPGMSGDSLLGRVGVVSAFVEEVSAGPGAGSADGRRDQRSARLGMGTVRDLVVGSGTGFEDRGSYDAMVVNTK